MRKTAAILGRELRGYFCSPIAYVILFLFVFINGLQFYLMLTFTEGLIEPTIRILYGGVAFWFLSLLVPPVLTMRAFAEEKRTGTIEMLMTAPVKDSQVVLGKFLAALIFNTGLWATLLVFVGILEVLGNPDWGPVIATYMGIIGIGAMFVSAGVFASTLSRNQLIAAIVAVSINLLVFFLSFIRYLFRGLEDRLFLDYLSPWNHFLNDFSRGIVDLRYIAVYATFTVIFLYLAVRLVEARKWS